jgi:hypothetical protein
MDQLSVLQAIRLKDRVSQADLAATPGRDQATLTTEIEKLVEAGMLVEGKPCGSPLPGGMRSTNCSRPNAAASTTRQYRPPTTIFAG